MSNSNIVEVRYTSTGPYKGQRRWLDTSTGLVYDDCRIRLIDQCNSNFKPTAKLGEWSNGVSHLEAVKQDAPTPALERNLQTPSQEPDLKFDSGKPRWSLLMQGLAKSLAGVVAVLTFGAKKYAAHSWRNVQNGQERYKDALYRHLHAIESGELTDPESGCSHWSHVATNALFLHELEIQNAK